MEVKLNKIEAHDRTINEVLDKKKYTIDIFQREYKWQRKHIEQLLSDLFSRFFVNYDEKHTRKQVETYSRYFLGSIVLSQKGAVRFIIDGQQRLTSITLLLIYLKNLQKDKQDPPVGDLIFSLKYGERSYNLQIEERKDCIEALYNGREYDTRNTKDASVMNIVERYNDIQGIMSGELDDKSLPYFIDWLINNVVFVEIITYSDDDAYTIFETMNDRGLNLTPTEMLKGYLLSSVNEEKQKNELNGLWRTDIQRLNEIAPDTDSEFFKAWLRSKYAETARQRRKGAENEDFEKIGTRFHSWVRDNKERMGLKASDDFYSFVKNDFRFYVDFHLTVLKAEENLIPGLENVYYVGKRGFTFMYPLVMAPVKATDDEETMARKVALVSRYLETYIVCRSINYRTLGYDSIRYSVFSLIKEIRNKDVDELAKIFKAKVTTSDEKLSAVKDFRLSGYYKWFVHFLLARITYHIEQKCGVASSFENYIETGSRAPFEIEHIVADDFKTYGSDFADEKEFESFRNMMGNLILLPNGFNQSYGKLPYEQKLPLYFGQNLLAQTLNTLCYQNNPNFLKYAKASKIPFKPHEHFKKQDIIDRSLLYQKICEEIWSPEEFDIIANS